MLVFHKIRYKNFLSSGNQFTEIDFEKNHTNLIIGTNGAGKSTILDALTFVLFNKPFRKINKPQLANTTNEKDCLVEIEFSVNNRDYLVRRGIKPNVFDIEVNGNPLHKEADDRANQKILEENILKVNYKSFTQIVILGSSTFVPFMQLTTANRREVIEDLLDIRIFSAMNNLIKDKIRTQKDQVKSLELKKENLKDKMKMQQNFIEELENRGNANINANKEKIAKLDDEVGVYISENAKTEEKIYKFTKEQEEVIGAGDKLVKLNNLKGKISQKVSVITKEHKFFTENTVCPTCTQTIEEEFRLNRITDAQFYLDVDILYLDQLTTKKGVSVFGKTDNAVVIKLRGTLFKEGLKTKEVEIEESSSEIAMTTLTVDTGGKFNQTSLSNALKKGCDKLVTKLFEK